MARDFPYELLNFFRTVEVVEQRETHVLRVNAITARFAELGVLHDCYLLGPHVVGAHRSSKKRKMPAVFRSAIYAPQGFGIGVIRSLNYSAAVANPWDVLQVNRRDQFVGFCQWPAIVQLTLLGRLIQHLRQFQSQIIENQNLA
jgi:hypothetical protein